MSTNSSTAWRHKRWAKLRDLLDEEPKSTESTQSGAETSDPSVKHGLDDGTLCEIVPLSPLVNESPPPPPPTVATQLDDLLHIQLAFIQQMVAFSTYGRPLRFAQDPICDTHYERWHAESGRSCNSGTPLHPQDKSNRSFLEYQDWLVDVYGLLKNSNTSSSAEVKEYRDGLMRQVVIELERLEDIKETEWEQQRSGATAGAGSGISVSEGSRFTVNTDRLASAQWSFWTPAAAPIYSYCIVSAASNVLLGLSRKATGVLMAGLRSTIRLTLEYARAPGPLLPQDHRLLRQLNRDPRTILNALDLDPHVIAYNCCSRCFALYIISADMPSTCTSRSAPESPLCDTKLFRKRKIGKKDMAIPVRKYLHQSATRWLGRMLCREDVEQYFRVSHWNNGQPRSPMRDIFDGIALQSLKGPISGQAFLDGPPGEYRLVFGLSADGFNPYQMKEAKHSVTSTAIYMVCFNLPEHLRYLPENIYLVGVIPGPTKPSTTQINHFLSLVVDEFLDLWDPGVYYTRTALNRDGCLVRAAIVPIIADLLAARQLSGLGPHNHNRILCSVCTIAADNVENVDPSTFTPRDLEQHRALATEWLKAPNTVERELLFEKTGVRYTELLRLDYWNPLLYTVIDTMHNLYLGVLQRHIRTIWGINVDVGDGDASGIDSGSIPGRPDEDKMSAGLHLLLHGSEAELRKAGKAVLYHLCLDRGIRRAGTVSQLVKNLVAWRKKEGILAGNSQGRDTDMDSRLSMMPDYGDSGPSDAIRAAERTLQGPKAATALARKKKDVLLAMCQVRNLETEGPKDVLAKRLLSWLEDQRLTSALQEMTLGDAGSNEGQASVAGEKTPLGLNNTSRHGTSTVPALNTSLASRESMASAPVETETLTRHAQDAIGRDTLSAYVEDRLRMETPSWVNAPPVAFGTKQHGKLSADQWRSLCVLNLPVTLIRTWSFQEERRVKMLRNFLELVEAVETFGLLEMDEQKIGSAETLMQRYLEGVKELYKGAKIQPNHHLALHIGVFLRLFGPVHSWRAFVFERFNYFLQTLNTNMTFGELEMTFMMHSCRVANFQPLLRSPAVKHYMDELSRAMLASNQHDRRGMRLDAILRSSAELKHDSPLGEPYKGAKAVVLEPIIYEALLERLSLESANQYEDERLYFASHPPRRLPLPRFAIPCHSVLLSGIVYKISRRSTGDSNIMFRHPALGSSEPRPGRLDQIFLHTRQDTDGRDLTETFLIVKYYKELRREDAAKDPYRKYPTVGGKLYYEAFEDRVLALRCSDITSHFALTRMDHISASITEMTSTEGGKSVKFSGPCIHVKPLDRLLREVRANNDVAMAPLDVSGIELS